MTAIDDGIMIDNRRLKLISEIPKLLGENRNAVDISPTKECIPIIYPRYILETG
jgi:hypothetical protein